MSRELFIETHGFDSLVKQAKAKGFSLRKLHIDQYPIGTPSKALLKPHNYFHHALTTESTIVLYYGVYVIYRKGKWVRIIKNLKKEEEKIIKSFEKVLLL
jgi:hypothetical protein